MTDDSREVIRDLVAVFSVLHRSNKRDARVMVISSFATCYAMLDVSDRLSVLDAILAIARDINTTIFEDGGDFVEYLTEVGKKYEQF